MKKKLISFFLILIFCFAAITTYSAEKLEYHKLTKEEIGGEIDIPNREGSYDNYENINTYEDLYEVLEDLSIKYKQLLEEYNSLNDDYEELYNELEEYKEEYENTDKKQPEVKYTKTDKILMIIVVAIIIYYLVIVWIRVNNKK